MITGTDMWWPSSVSRATPIKRNAHVGSTIYIWRAIISVESTAGWRMPIIHILTPKTFTKFRIGKFASLFEFHFLVIWGQTAGSGFL